jgi:hypothetical protein
MAIKTKISPESVVGPLQPITVQAQLQPNSAYRQSVTGDGIAPSGSLAFMLVAPLSVQTRQKRKRDAVNAIITNMHQIHTRLNPQWTLRCLGVVGDGILDENGVLAHPDAIGRVGILVSGVVEVLSTPSDLAALTVGDTVTWQQQDNATCYQGYPDTWSTAKLVKASPPLGVLAENVSYTPLFGTSQSYSDRHLSTLQTQLAVLQHREKGWALDMTGVTGMSPFQLVSQIAHVLLARLDINIPSGQTWVDVLYTPSSPYYIMESRPTNSMAPEWLQHCFGNLNNDEYIEKSPGYGLRRCDNATPGRYFLPQSMGWSTEFLVATNKINLYRQFKQPNVYFPETQLSPTELFTAVTTKTIDAATEDDVQHYLNVIGPDTHSRALALQYIHQGLMKSGTPPATLDGFNKTCLKALPYLAKTGYTFNTITHTDADRLVNALQTKPGLPKTWCHTHRRALVFPRTRVATNSIGILLAKTTTHATLRLDLQ